MDLRPVRGRQTIFRPLLDLPVDVRLRVYHYVDIQAILTAPASRVALAPIPDTPFVSRHSTPFTRLLLVCRQIHDDLQRHWSEVTMFFVKHGFTTHDLQRPSPNPMILPTMRLPAQHSAQLRYLAGGSFLAHHMSKLSVDDMRNQLPQLRAITLFIDSISDPNQGSLMLQRHFTFEADKPRIYIRVHLRLHSVKLRQKKGGRAGRQQYNSFAAEMTFDNQTSRVLYKAVDRQNPSLLLRIQCHLSKFNDDLYQALELCPMSTRLH